MNQKPHIQISHVRKVYPQKVGDQIIALGMAALRRANENLNGGVALQDLTLSIENGERMGIIGRNGAGKSTLLQMLAGVTEPSSGEIHISGKVTAVLTLGTGLREDLTGRENIYLEGETKGKDRKKHEKDVSAIIEFAELGKFIDLPLRTYSTGMKARLAFAIITQIKPEILIIDEALSVGDAAFSAKAAKRISDLCALGSIVLIVSHSMQSIRALCNRCLWLDQGRLVMDGPPDKVTHAYLESVRKADEQNHAARFRSLVGVRKWSSGFDMEELQVNAGNQTMKCFPSGTSLSLTCQCRRPADTAPGEFVVRCIRLDGALISENKLPAWTPSAQHQIRMTYPNFNLAPGMYRLQLEWQGPTGAPRAESATIIEVTAEDVPTGGRPVLLGVATAFSRKEKFA